MQDVLYTKFGQEPPIEIRPLFNEIRELPDSPEEGLYWDGKELKFHWYDEHHQIEREVYFNFRETLSDLQKKLGPPPKELLGRALGKGESLEVWDISGGTGRDALSFYHWGHKVKVFERHPIIAALLINALRLEPRMIERFEVVYGSAHELNHIETPEVIYYDPMYPEEIKKSRPRKEMALFKVLTNGDSDQETVLDWALNSGAKRIILKRPIKASECSPKPTASFKGKTIRFDLWQRG
ncbi:MAG: hypothetical protein CME70_01410 [Halobacteriovorax sp.]|nr:hypothetical protein [Halobacteriovorax sp.]|tara:strand:+ start:8032 stop:8748 length:717 start_codon:yes stop_codon:yes gene_type:complete